MESLLSREKSTRYEQPIAHTDEIHSVSGAETKRPGQSPKDFWRSALRGIKRPPHGVATISFQEIARGRSSRILANLPGEFNQGAAKTGANQAAHHQHIWSKVHGQFC